MKLIAIIAIALVSLRVVLVILERYQKKQRAKFKQQINKRCDEILANAAKTEAMIITAKAEADTLPEEYRAKFLAEYNQLEEKLNEVRQDCARIRESFEIEVTV